MTRPNGVHHIAICTANMKAQIEFFTKALGMELTALYWMHGAVNTQHGFLRLNDQCSLAFVQSPEVGKIPIEMGKTHAGNPGDICAPGTLQHIALSVDSEAELLALRDRIRSYGVQVLGHIDHGVGKSIYFAGPENLTLEISTSEGQAMDPEAWIDPEVVALNAITADELAGYKAPARYVRPASAVQQPSMNADQPRMNLPPEVYQQVMSLPDEVVLASMSETTPPVAVAG